MVLNSLLLLLLPLCIEVRSCFRCLGRFILTILSMNSSYLFCHVFSFLETCPYHFLISSLVISSPFTSDIVIPRMHLITLFWNISILLTLSFFLLHVLLPNSKRFKEILVHNSIFISSALFFLPHMNFKAPITLGISVTLAV